MDKVTQQNAANAEESAGAAEELNAQAGSIDRIIGQLISLVGGTSGDNGAPKTERPTTRRELSHSDRAFHQITEDRTADTREVRSGRSVTRSTR